MTLPNRLAIIGCSGAGKSTLARQLAPIMGLPLIHLDAEFWNPGWVETPRPIWKEKVRNLLSGERWIIDGNFGHVQELTMQAADTVLFLDFPRWLCMTRVFKRSITHAGRPRPDMNQGCPERLDFEFLEFVWNFGAVSRPKIFSRAKKVQCEHKLLPLRTPAEVERFVKNMEQRCRSIKQ